MLRAGTNGGRGSLLGKRDHRAGKAGPAPPTAYQTSMHKLGRQRHHSPRWLVRGRPLSGSGPSKPWKITGERSGWFLGLKKGSYGCYFWPRPCAGPIAQTRMVDLSQLAAATSPDEEWHEVSQRFQPAIIVLSYIVSVIGSFTTLELLHRRSARKGWQNWLLLFGAALSLGGCGIWSMHFIGNNALVLGENPATTLQLIYTPGYTLLSFFVAVFCVGIAFYFVGSVEDASLMRIGLVGILAGLGIPSMHYVGQFAIAHYRIYYDVGAVVASFFIGVTALSAALVIFFYLKSRWKDLWIKRFGCALIMGVAVCGMHYCGMSATHYWTNGENRNLDVGPVLPPNSVVGFIAGIATSGCLILLTLALVANHRARKLKSRVKKIVLACAYFDEHGRILVYNDGMIPVRTIDNEFYQQGSDAELTPAHPLFQFLFKTSWSWGAFRSDLAKLEKEGARERDVSFLKKFHVTAERLADELGVPLGNAGVLYDQMLTTGYMRGNVPAKDGKQTLEPEVDSEKALATLHNVMLPEGKGQMLFLLRRIQSSDRYGPDHFTSRGFRFGPADIMARNVSPLLQVPGSVLQKSFQDMNRFVTYGLKRPDYLPGSVFASAFIVWPTLAGGLHVLADADSRARVPTVEILPPDFSPEEKSQEFDSVAELRQMAQSLQGLALPEVISALREVRHLAGGPAPNSDPSLHRLRSLFAYSAALSVEKLGKQFGDTVVSAEATLHPEIIPLANRSYSLLFKAIIPLHHALNSRAISDNVCVVPFSLFQTFHALVNTPPKTSPVSNLFAPIRLSQKELPKQLQTRLEKADAAGDDEHGAKNNAFAPPSPPGQRNHFHIGRQRTDSLQHLQQNPALLSHVVVPVASEERPWFVDILKSLI
ncbi:uncharacterized protein VTP21DRAFT_8818 [Calcarisporiella thermophila]|uniref:uncharacterized protein n=1 Tax=Calcarisporiella thermophila TaxID=911321 RepID=UPI00374361E4